MSKLPDWLRSNAKKWLVPGLVLLMAVAILLMITGNWNTWASESAEQKTDDAYIRSDLTPWAQKSRVSSLWLQFRTINRSRLETCWCS
jgi:multidrug resistance efflux pump